MKCQDESGILSSDRWIFRLGFEMRTSTPLRSSNLSDTLNTLEIATHAGRNGRRRIGLLLKR